MIWTCNAEGLCDYLSAQWVHYTGIPEAEQLGSAWINQLHPDDKPITLQRWAAAGAAQHIFDTEFRLRRADGAYRWFKTRAIPTFDANRNIVKWFGTSTDIQELKEAQHQAVTLAQELEARVAEQTYALRTTNERLLTLSVQLQTALQAAGVGSWEYDLTTGDVTWSDELFHIFGMPVAQTAPRYPEQQALYEASSWVRLQAAVTRCVESGDAYEMPLTAIHRDGERFSTIACGRSIRNATGTVVRLVGTLQDVSEIEKIATKVRQLSERLQIATSAANIGVWEWDIPTNRLVWDETMYRLYDTSEADFSGAYDAWRSAVHPDDLADAEQGLINAVHGIADFRTVFRIVKRNGEIRYIRAEGSMHCDADGRPSRMIGVNWDITEQRVAELALSRSEAVKSAILASAGSAIIATQIDGIITLFNPAAEELLGYAADDVIGRVTPGLFHDPNEVELMKHAREAELGIKINAPFEVFVTKTKLGKTDSNEWTYIHKNGARIPVWLSVSAMHNKDGTIVGFLGVASNLTTQKAQENELRLLNQQLAERSIEAESASNAKTMFLANMSHEIRTPIGAIMSVTYLLARTGLSKEQQELLGTIERSSKTLLGMINNVLDLSKIEAQQVTLEHKPFALNDVLGEIANLITAYAADKSLELVIDTEPNLPNDLMGDRIRLVQILTNLAGNAVKFTDKGQIRLQIRRALTKQLGKERLRFEIQDTGPGIDKYLLEKLFTPFTQGEQHGKSRPPGTGLGLAIVKQLVTLMHGDVGVMSEPNKGTTFWFEIPFDAPPQSFTKAEPGSFRVLIVEDHEFQRMALASCVERLGWTANTAASGTDAIAMVRERHKNHLEFNIILIDWKMPELDGLETLSKILREYGEDKMLPSIIMTTAYDLAELRCAPLISLADAVISKPVTPSTLYDTVLQVTTAHKKPAPFPQAPEQMHRRQTLQGVRVLVVDDSDINRELARRILELEGAHVELAVDGQEAVTRVTSGHSQFDVVLMDIQMPNEDGISATKRIRQDGRFQHLPIIALTAAAFISEQTRALAAGMSDFVTKPFDPEALLQRIKAWVSRSKTSYALPSAAIPPRPSSSDWPLIEGVDPQDVKMRFGGDVTLFRSLLSRFRTELTQDHNIKLLTLPISDPAATCAWIHKICGSAGNLGAREIQLLASQAEHVIKDENGSTTDKIAGVIGSLAVAIEKFVQNTAAIAKSLPITNKGSTGEALDVESLARALLLLRQQDLEAVPLLTKINHQLQGKLAAGDYARLQKALEELDFTVAHTLLSALAHPSAQIPE